MNFLIFIKYITKNYPILIGATFFVLVIGGLIKLNGSFKKMIEQQAFILEGKIS